MAESRSPEGTTSSAQAGQQQDQSQQGQQQGTQAKRPPFHVEVSEEFARNLEHGYSVLQRPVTPGMPSQAVNALHGKPYHGINALILDQAAADRNYGDNRYVTFKQSDTLGAQIRSGSKSIPVQFWTSTDRRGGELDRPRTMIVKLFNVQQLSVAPTQDRRTMPSNAEKTWAGQYIDALLKDGNLQNTVAAYLLAKNYGAAYNPDRSNTQKLIDEIKADPVNLFKSSREANKVALSIGSDIQFRKDRLLEKAFNDAPVEDRRVDVNPYIKGEDKSAPAATGKTQAAEQETQTNGTGQDTSAKPRRTKSKQQELSPGA